MKPIKQLTLVLVSFISECPNERCKHMQKGNPRSPAMTCVQCGEVYCFTHGAAHIGHTCAEYNRLRARELQLNNAFITRRTVLWYVGLVPAGVARVLSLM